MHRKAHVGIQATSRLFTFSFFTPLSVTKTNSTKKKKRRNSFHLTTQFLRYVSVEPPSARVRADICIVFRALSSNVSPDRTGAKTDHNKKGGTRSLDVKSAPRGKKKKNKKPRRQFLELQPRLVDGLHGRQDCG
uniref:Uncharacterized protein n=1 Tax=Ixodes ricinus TaxID=34613 RepID=A0A147BHM5_IXORI